MKRLLAEFQIFNQHPELKPFKRKWFTLLAIDEIFSKFKWLVFLPLAILAAVFLFLSTFMRVMSWLVNQIYTILGNVTGIDWVIDTVRIERGAMLTELLKVIKKPE